MPQADPYAKYRRQPHGDDATTESADPYAAYRRRESPISPSKPIGRRIDGSSFGEKIGNAAKAIGGWLPTVGGTVGSMVGGVPGAAVGGAAGEGYRQLAEHATELPGALADIARNWREIPAMARGAVAGAGEGAVSAGTQAALQGAFTGAGNVVAKGAARLAPALMQSALKPGIKSTLAAVKGGKTPSVVQTLLDEGINVTPGGIEKLNRIISGENVKITDALASLPQGSMAVSTKDVATRLLDTAARVGKQVNPVDDLQAVARAGREFVTSHGPYLTLPEAQALKTGTYTALKDKAYGELKGAAIESQKALARGLKEEIAAEAQRAGIDLGAMNAREGAAITARDAIAKRVAQVGNRDPAGLAWLAHSPVTFLMALSERSPVVKSMIARGLYQSAGKVAKVPVEAIRWAVGAVASQQEPE